MPADGAAFRHYIWPIFDKTPSFSDFVRSGFVLSSYVFYALAYRFFKKRFFPANGPIADFFDSDVVLGIGGGYLSHDYGFIRPYCDYLLAKFLGKKVVLYSHSIGPFGGFINKTVSKFVLGNIDLILVREERSKRNLEEIGIRNVHFTADVAFAFDKIKPRFKRKQTTVICTRASTYRFRKKQEDYILFLGRIARKVLDRFGGEVIMLPTTSEDIHFHELLKPRLPEEVRYVGEVRSPHEIMELLSESGFLISSRVHPIILGSLSATPFFAIGWEYKLDEISSMLCSEKCFARASELDDSVEDLILKRIAEKEKLAVNIAKNVRLVKEKSGRNPAILRESIRGWGYSL